MFGGVAQSYCRYKLDGEPFKEGKALYIYVLHPITKARKKVRWYTDKTHAALMPQTQPANPLYKVFGFTSPEDTIVAIRERNLTKEEIEDYFSYKWQFCGFFGGIWYAPNGTDLPPIKNAHRFFDPTWQEFQAEGQKNSKALGLVPESESVWFKKEAA